MYKIFRYPLSDTFMIIGIIVASMAIICGASLYQRVEDSNRIGTNYKYENETIIGYYRGDDGKLDIAKNLCCDGVNIELTDVCINIGGATRVSTVICQYDEELPYAINNGRYLEKRDIEANKNVINIGKKLEQYTYKSDDVVYINIDDIPYEVIGYLGEYDSSSLDSVILLYYSNLDEKHKKQIDNMNYVNVRYGSNLNNVNQKITNIINDLPEGIEYSICDVENFTVASSSNHDKEFYYFAIYAFAVGICIVISELWIYQRMEEIAILKTIGFSVKKIVSRIYISLLQIIIVANIFSYTILWTIEKILGYKMIYIEGIYIVIIFMLLASMGVLIIPISKINKIEPAKCINSRGNF